MPRAHDLPEFSLGMPGGEPVPSRTAEPAGREPEARPGPRGPAAFDAGSSFEPAAFDPAATNPAGFPAGPVDVDPAGAPARAPGELDPTAADKLAGRFPYAADLYAEGMLWAAVVRSPHASALLRGVDPAAARAMPGVEAVLVAADVRPEADAVFGHPVLARDVVRYRGEPIALVAARHPALAARAARAVAVRYDELAALTEPAGALTSPPIHPAGNVVAHRIVTLGDVDAATAGSGADREDRADDGAVVAEQHYVFAATDPAPTGAVAAFAIPFRADDGTVGVELHAGSPTPAADRRLLARALGLPLTAVRVVATGRDGDDAGVDPAFHAQLGLLARHTGRPVKAVLDQAEGFAVRRRRPAVHAYYRHHADAAGTLVAVEARLLLDGGAYPHDAEAALDLLCRHAVGPYRVPHVRIEAWAVRTNSPSAGRPSGAGGIAGTVAAEAQLDDLAHRLGVSGIELRLRNVVREGDVLPDGRRIAAPVPVAQLVRACLDAPMPAFPPGPDVREFPGVTGRTGELTRLRRGVGLTLAMHDLTPAVNAVEHAAAQVTLSLDREGPVATVTCALGDAGSGVHAFLRRVAREVLGVERVAVHQPADPDALPCSPAPRHPLWVFGGAVERAARAVRAQAVRRLAESAGLSPELFEIRGGEVVSYDNVMRRPLSAVLAAAAPPGTVLYATERFVVGGRPDDGASAGGRFTAAPGEAIVALAAQRAVVDVDTELGVVRVVDVSVAHEVGRAVCREQLTARVERGVVAGVGLAVIEAFPAEPAGPLGGRAEEPDEVIGAPVALGLAGYPVLTALDQPAVRVVDLVETVERAAVPLGVKPVGELALAGTPAAVLAAIRDATGVAAAGLPVRPSALIPVTA